jgi:hypothetical protein
LSESFRYDELPVFDAFEQVSDPAIYAPLPDAWQVGVADVVKSTDALKAGRYKSVNMAGAAIVGAVRNALEPLAFPFVFGGDGAILAVPPEVSHPARAAMAATVNFVAAELNLDLRVGMISVGAIRAAGHDLRVARYAASPEAVFAMFSGGGASYAEAELKAGRIAIAPAEEHARPNLAGLSCRWTPISARRGLILSLLVAPVEGTPPGAFRNLAAEIIRITERDERAGHPVPEEGPVFALNPSAMRLEAAATRNAQPLLSRWGRIMGEMLLAMALDRTGRSMGRFNPRRYRSWVTRNSDFRKYDDALRMTIDCSTETADELEALLSTAEAERVADYGLHRQDSALMTCIVPSYVSDDHVHFLDGAGGGYALAALNLKEKRARRDAAGLAA